MYFGNEISIHGDEAEANGRDLVGAGAVSFGPNSTGFHTAHGCEER